MSLSFGETPANKQRELVARQKKEVDVPLKPLMGV